MSQTGGSSNTTLAQVLVDVPDEILPIFDKIIGLIDPEFQPLVADILRMVPHDILLGIMKSKPDSKVRIIECINNVDGKTKHVRYASWVKRGLMPKCLEGVDWATIMGEVKDQLDHDICWAVVASELIRAVILIERPDTDPSIRFSIQDLVDHTDPVERRNIKGTGHYCYTSSINRGMKYVMENGILTEEDRPFAGCPEDIPDRQQSELSYIKDFKRLHTVDEALLQLKHQPIGAAVAMFYPEFKEIGENMYRGPVLQNSRLVGLHAVSLVKAGVKNGERYIKVRSSNGAKIGNKGYVDVSLDVMFAYVPTPGEETDTLAKKYFAEASPLLRRFSYPRLLTRDEEEEKRRGKRGR